MGRLAYLASALVLGTALLSAADARFCPDLDGDRQPDLLRLSRTSRDSQGYLYILNIEMSSGAASRTVRFHSASPDGVRIVARDIDGDHDIDLVITNAFDWRPAAVLVNDGAGVFTASDIQPVNWSAPGKRDSGWDLPANVSGAAVTSGFTEAVAAICPGYNSWDRPPTMALAIGEAVSGESSAVDRAGSRAPPVR